jgi:hypothetical protein
MTYTAPSIDSRLDLEGGLGVELVYSRKVGDDGDS